MLERPLAGLLALSILTSGCSVPLDLPAVARALRGRQAARRGEAFTAVGLDLLPRGVVDQHFSQRGHAERLRRVIESHPDLFGLGIDEATSVVVQGREVRVLGEGTVMLLTGARSSLLRRGQTFDLVEVQQQVGGRPQP